MSTSPPERRRLRLGAALLASIAIAVALITLLSLERFPLLPDDLNAAVVTAGGILVQLVTIVGAIAVILGILNLLGVHLRQLQTMPRGLYSLITVLTLLAVIVVRVLERTGSLTVTGLEAPSVSLTMMDALQVAVESALAGLLFFFLVYAAYRMLRRGVTAWGLLFIAALVLVLVGHSPLTGMEFLSPVREWLLNVPVNAGTRGLLIGVAIGTVVVGVRVVMGRDRTFRE